MKSAALNIAKAAAAGFLLSLPFAILELVTGNPAMPRGSFPTAVFVYLWIVGSIFFLNIFSIARTGGALRLNLRTFVFGAKILVAIVTAWSWATLILDQMPCFLGATGC